MADWLDYLINSFSHLISFQIFPTDVFSFFSFYSYYTWCLFNSQFLQLFFPHFILFILITKCLFEAKSWEDQENVKNLKTNVNLWSEKGMIVIWQKKVHNSFIIWIFRLTRWNFIFIIWIFNEASYSPYEFSYSLYPNIMSIYIQTHHIISVKNSPNEYKQNVHLHLNSLDEYKHNVHLQI